MDKFINVTSEGNEKAIRRGTRVPEEAVNMAWVKSPRLTPENNVVIVDTSRIVEENIIDNSYTSKIMYANALGVLEDEYGNQLVQEEFPAVADVFSIDEDWLTTPGSEYRNEHVLGFLHVSKYFHVDFPGLTLGTTPYTYNNDALKVVDGKGRHYVDDSGKPRYRLQITPATLAPSLDTDRSAAYRVLVYIDTITNEDLYLTYNKVEVSAEGAIINQDINYREILNPQPYFTYKPEESDVVDPNNRHRKWYSTKPLTLKQQVLDVPYPDVDGYKVYVPKKAMPDPRIFQLFRWRLACDFIQNYTVDPTRDTKTIKAGVLVTNSIEASQPYIFYNLGLSHYNTSKVSFINPLKETTTTVPSTARKDQADYWKVNLDTVTDQELDKFDILVFSPRGEGSFDFTPYLSKLKYITDTLGKTVIIESHGGWPFEGLGMTITRGVDPVTGNPTTTGSGTTTKLAGTTINIATSALEDPIFDGEEKLGGWELNVAASSAVASISPYKNASYSTNGYTNYIVANTVPSDYTVLLQGTVQGGTGTAPGLIRRDSASGGSLFISTIGLGSAPGQLFSPTTGKFVNNNTEATATATGGITSYQDAVNGFSVEGISKLLYNTVLYAIRGATMDSSDETQYSSSWNVYSPWKASWVINGEALLEQEKEENDFVFLAKDPTVLEPIWQRKLSEKTAKQLIDENLDEDDKVRIAGAIRTYRLEITNTEVHGTITISDNSRLYAYTEAYSPKFTVPIEMGPHVVKEDPIQGEFDAAQYLFKQYPPKPWKVQVQANYDDSSAALITQNVTVTAKGKGTNTYTTTTPSTVTTGTAAVELNWLRNSVGNHYSMFPGGFPEFGNPQPIGMASWQQPNYYTSNWGPGHECWGFYGIMGRWQQGSTGEIVLFIQEALSRFHHLGYFQSPVGYLTVDGNYGPKTEQAVRAFQTTFKARYIDGVVDAETLYIIGSQICRYQWASVTWNDSPNNHTRWFASPRNHMQIFNASDGNPSTTMTKRSWISGGPSVIWDLYAITFSQQYTFTGISMTADVPGNVTNMMWRSIDVRTLGSINDTRSFLTNYDSYSGLIKEMPLRINNGQKYYQAIGPYTGNTIIVGVGQDQSSGHGTSRCFGIRELVAHTTTTTSTTTPGTTQEVSKVFNFTSTKTVQVTTGSPVTFQLNPPQPPKGNLSNIQWTEVSSNNPNVSVTMNSNGLVTVTTNLVSVKATTNYTKGPQLPLSSGVTYTRSNNQSNAVPNSGWVSKSDGVLLVSTQDGKPAGFPTMPTAIPGDTQQRHYTTFTLANLASDPSILVGFYDVVAKEFIVNAAGNPEISYIDYVRRGPQNIYIGIISNYEIQSSRPIPVVDAPPLPFKWAMPVYGVTTSNGSRIGIEPLPSGLGPQDIWYVPIRTGKFNKLFDVRPKINGPLTDSETIIAPYAGTKVRAFYSVPEAERGGWSTIYGRPNIDIVDETPFIVDDNVIQVRQAPIHMVKEPTLHPSLADPVNPIFEIKVRDTINSPWRIVNGAEILDYNVSEGTIFFKEPLPGTDPNLIKVNYTTSRKSYPFKVFNNQKLNLNPYPGHSRDLIGRPIYVYIVPTYIKDNLGRVIPDSYESNPLRFTLDPNIFDQLDPQFNPLAIQLGVVYITSALDIEDLVVLDTRRRGGGSKDSRTKEEISRMVQESYGYWDIGHGAGLSYQKGGFIIVRLPEQLREQFPDPQDIINTIRRNAPAGVEFKIEDLFGKNWS